MIKTNDYEAEVPVSGILIVNAVPAGTPPRECQNACKSWFKSMILRQTTHAGVPKWSQNQIKTDDSGGSQNACSPHCGRYQRGPSLGSAKGACGNSLLKPGILRQTTPRECQNDRKNPIKTDDSEAEVPVSGILIVNAVPAWNPP